MVVKLTFSVVIQAWSVLLVKSRGKPEEKPSSNRAAILGF
jgi:hypothetical protein